MFEFQEPFLSEVNRNIAKYPKGRQASAVLCLLDQAQRQNHAHGAYVTDEAIDTIAKMLDMPRIRVVEVASFFTMINLRPVGKFHIEFCGTTPCQLCGAEDILHAIETKLGIKKGETTKDGMFTLTEVECLGACCNAPMVQINDDFFEDLTVESINNIIDDLRAGRAVRVGSQMGRVSSEPLGLADGLKGTNHNAELP